MNELSIDTINNEKLRNIAKAKGYKVVPSPYKNYHVNQSKKFISVWCQINQEENMYLCHELGHVYFWKIDRIFVILNEIIAWIIGYIICKVNKIDTKDFYKIMKKCLKTYIKC